MGVRDGQYLSYRARKKMSIPDAKSQENAQRQHERLNATRTAFAQPAQTKHPVEIYLSVDALNENTSSLDSVPQDGYTV